MSNEEVTGFAGRVEHLELQHIIQIACLAGIYATIVVWRGNQKGYIYSAFGVHQCKYLTDNMLQ